MAYKKYIVRNGKTYGPYTYHSRRVNGRVVSEYHGTKHPKNHKKIFLMIGFAFLVLIAGYIVFNFDWSDMSLTGQAVVDVEADYLAGETLNGMLGIELKKGELLPSDSKVVFETASGESYEYILSDVVNAETTEGDFYVEGLALEGAGEGYGVVGAKQIYPDVDFILEISGEATEVETETETNEESSSEDNVAEETTEETETETEEEEATEGTAPEGVPSEEGKETTEEEAVEETGEEEVAEEEVTEEKEKKEKEEVAASSGVPSEEGKEAPAEESESAEEPAAEPAGITGAVVRAFGGFFNFFQGMMTGNVVDENMMAEDISEIGGTVSGTVPFIYTLSEGQTASIKEGSVTEGAEVVLVIEDGEATVTTTYSEDDEEGFGADYLEGTGKELAINLNELGIIVEEGTLTIKVVYSDQEIISMITELDVEGSIDLEEKTLTEEELEEIEIEIEDIGLTVGDMVVLSELVANFSLDNVKTASAEVVNNRMFVKYVLEEYWIEYTYDYSDGMNSALVTEMEVDKIKWLKDLASNLGAEEAEVQDVLGLINKEAGVTETVEEIVEEELEEEETEADEEAETETEETFEEESEEETEDETETEESDANETVELV